MPAQGVDFTFECSTTLIVADTESYEALVAYLDDSGKAVRTIKDVCPVNGPGHLALLTPLANSTTEKVIEAIQPRIDQGRLAVVAKRGIMLDCGSTAPEQKAAFAAAIGRLPTVTTVYKGRFLVVIPQDQLNDIEVSHIRPEINRIATSIL